MSKILIFGGTGGIGLATTIAFRQELSVVVALGSNDLDLRTATASDVWNILSDEDPDVVVHCAGVIGEGFQDLFNVNVGSAWRILSYYLSRPPIKKVNIVVVGSSSYNRPSPNYELYAASKAALVSLVTSMSIKFEGTNVILTMLNPGKTNTQMRLNAVGREPVDMLLSADEVGREIVRLSKEKSGVIVEINK